MRVTLDGLIVTNGNATFGGGIATGFDLDNPGLNVVTVIDSVIRDNSATDYGGGVANDHGNVTLIDTAVRENSAVIGGGIHNSRDQGDLSLNGTSSVSGNLASGNGGGIYADTHGNVELHDESSVHHNSAGGNGGGIYVGDSVVRLNDRSSVHSNTAGGNGGGVFIAAMFAVFELLDDSSVSGNSPNNVCQRRLARLAGLQPVDGTPLHLRVAAPTARIHRPPRRAVAGGEGGRDRPARADISRHQQGRGESNSRTNRHSTVLVLIPATLLTASKVIARRRRVVGSEICRASRTHGLRPLAGGLLTDLHPLLPPPATPPDPPWTGGS